jgi:hypothetical protein
VTGVGPLGVLIFGLQRYLKRHKPLNP